MFIKDSTNIYNNTPTSQYHIAEDSMAQEHRQLNNTLHKFTRFSYASLSLNIQYFEMLSLVFDFFGSSLSFKGIIMEKIKDRKL